MGGLLNPFTFHTIYDTVGRLKKFIDSANRETVYAYDDANRTNTVTNAELETTTVKYNQRFQTIEVKDALNQVYNFSYDALGRQLTQTRAGAVMSYEYDAVGNRTKRTDYAGRITNYEYDNLNRLKKIIYGEVSSTTPNLEAVYTYDDISRLKTAANEAGTVSLDYDNRHRITSTTDVFGHLINYEYEHTPSVNQQRLKFDGAMYAVYNFDDADRLANIVDSNDSSQINFGYDNADRLTSKVLPNGVTTTYEYDGMSRLKRLKDVSSTATLFDRQYAYNPANQISQITEPSQTRNFGYDNIDRLTSATYSNTNQPNENYVFDNVGNRTSSHKSASYAYQTGQFNRLASTATANYNYDANGNLVTKSEGKNFWRFTWDYENRLTSASTRKETVRYKYDALGRRVQRYFRGGKENTKFIYDGQDVLVDDNNGVLTKYQNGLGIDDKLKISLNGTAKYFLADHLGSTNGLADSSGNLTEQTAYDSFGTATTNLSTRYQFTGREYDNFTGLHYYRARFYDAQIGRFTSEDPIGFAGGYVNLFAYVGNNSLNFSDPFGLDEYAMMERLKSPKPSRRGFVEMMDDLQMILAGIGMVPILGEPADAVDGLVSVGRGNYCDAALSAASMAPFFGAAAGAAKVGKRAEKFLPRGGVYVLVDSNTGKVMRGGRTNDLERRMAEHARDPELGKFDFRPKYRTDDYAEQRGLEELLYNKYSNAPFNFRRGISEKNPNRRKYLNAAYDFLSKLN
ncbi:MAG: RHS repeat-associated core domain-containing protein [Pyrinomonadaceae bacterium]|nr:RHS repeat-associated core domain-containing protein [Pyrinomonadaceae bacterium]